MTTRILYSSIYCTYYSRPIQYRITLFLKDGNFIDTLHFIQEIFCNKMGNKSTIVGNIHSDLMSHIISLDNIHGDETLQQLESILECVDSFSGDYSKISSKDMKLLVSVVTLLCNEFGRDSTVISSPAVIKACKIKAAASIYRLLGIPVVSKNALESCVFGLVNFIDRTDAELFSVALKCISIGLTSEFDDAFKFAICLQLEKCGFYEKVLYVFDDVALSSSSSREKTKNELLLMHAALMAADHLVWLLRETVSQSSQSISTNFKSFQTRIVGQILKHQDAIFELTRHTEGPVNLSVTMLVVQVLHGQERKLCSIIQVIFYFF